MSHNLEKTDCQDLKLLSLKAFSKGVYFLDAGRWRDQSSNTPLESPSLLTVTVNCPAG